MRLTNTPAAAATSSSSSLSSSSVSTRNRFELLRDHRAPGPTNSQAGNKTVFATRRRCSPMRILCANNDQVVATEYGTVRLRVRTSTGQVMAIAVHEVYYCKDIGANLLSGVKLMKDIGMSLTLSDSGGELTDVSGVRIPLNTQHGLMTIEGDAPAVVYSAVRKGLVISTAEELMSTHARLGHIGVDRLIDLLKSKKTRGLGELDMSKEELVKAREHVMHCAACREGKGTNSPFSGAAPMNHGSRHGEVIHISTRSRSVARI